MYGRVGRHMCNKNYSAVVFYFKWKGRRSSSQQKSRTKWKTITHAQNLTKEENYKTEVTTNKQNNVKIRKKKKEKQNISQTIITCDGHNHTHTWAEINVAK